MVGRPGRALAACLLFASLLLPGCLVGDDVNMEGIPEGSPPSGRNAGSASDHGDPERDEGSVMVEREGLVGISGRYVASRVITITNDFGGASEATVSLDTGAGGVATRAWSEGGYKLVVLLEARADSESEARSWLDRLVLTHSDRLSGGVLTLTSAVDFPDGPQNGVSLSGTLTQNLPSQPAYRIDLDAGSGGATTVGLGGPSASADTGSGGISIDGSFARVVADAGSGGIELLGTANSVDAGAGSGGISARLRAGGSGQWTFDTGSGGVDLTIVRSGGAEFDIVADTGSGGATVEVSDGEDVGSQSDDHRHVRTSGYDDAEVQVRIVADTGSGGVHIQD